MHSVALDLASVLLKHERMKRQNYSIKIDASAERIWNALWDDKNYRDWTSAFHPGSYAKTDGWKEGTTVHFLTPEGLGMYSRIASNVPMQRMEFEHLGEVKDGKEQPPTGESWAGAREIYTLEKNGDGLHLKVAVDVEESYDEKMQEMFSKALERVKKIAEG